MSRFSKEDISHTYRNSIQKNFLLWLHLIVSLTICSSVLPRAIAQQDQWDKTRPSFEVVSIHEHNPEINGRYDVNLPTIYWTGITTRMVLEQAFRLQGFQFANVPSWVDSDKYDLNVHASQSILSLSELEKYEQLEGMWRDMLISRYGLVYHRATQKGVVYELSCPNGKTKLTPSKPGEPYTMSVSDYRLSMHGVTMDDLAGQLSFQFNKIVRNSTGITGSFDLDIQWTSKEDMLADVGSTADGMQGGTTLTQALLDKYDIKLVRHKEDIPVVIVDEIHRPLPN